ncbi:hypothetical protein HYC85_014909 [Camellia sinensis]|uniref:COP9 signalosome complex subunit 6 n=1 Tax=Camellia sinensis TaxID=4442 RepID=A0A7J7H7M0_CAMSI|nr:hypothetical protein HYC85_014909 [Camellia sinensis]
MASSSSSGLTFKLHPLVILNISDHYTRLKSQSQPPHAAANGGEATIFGCVIGVQRGRTVEIFNSFELLSDPSTHSLDRPVPREKARTLSVPLFLSMIFFYYYYYFFCFGDKKVFPNFYILGWYSTGSEAQEADMQIHKALMDINESPVYVLLNPSINHAQKDLPVTIYESELHVIDGIPQLIFVRSSYTIETVEAERISIDHVAHLKPSDGGSAATQLAAHLTGIHSAIKMLNSRIRVLHHYLLAMQKGMCIHLCGEQASSERREHLMKCAGSIQESNNMKTWFDCTCVYFVHEDRKQKCVVLGLKVQNLIDNISVSNAGDIPCENSLLRQVSSLLRRLPAIESEKFQDDFLMEYNDTLLISYLAMFTNCSSTMNELVDKFNTAYDRQSRRGGRSAFF